jgi:hypothetical protein
MSEKKQIMEKVIDNPELVCFLTDKLLKLKEKVKNPVFIVT